MSGPISTITPDTGLVTIPAASGLTADDALPWLIDIDVFEQAIANTNWDAINLSSAALLNASKVSSGAQNDEISFDVVLAAGAWTCELLHLKTLSYGIISVQTDGSERGTIDEYGGPSSNTLSSVSFTTAVTKVYRLTLKVTGKNPSSAGYFAAIQHIQLRRTA